MGMEGQGGAQGGRKGAERGREGHRGAEKGQGGAQRGTEGVRRAGRDREDVSVCILRIERNSVQLCHASRVCISANAKSKEMN